MYNRCKREAKPTSSEVRLKRQYLKRNTVLKTEKKMNQKPYNKSLINLICSVCTGKYLPSVFSHRPCSFIARSEVLWQIILKCFSLV